MFGCRRLGVTLSCMSSPMRAGVAVALESGVKYVLQFVFALLAINTFFAYKVRQPPICNTLQVEKNVIFFCYHCLGASYADLLVIPIWTDVHS
jgi:hypothetical protein